MHQLGGGNIYAISILENYSRAMVASAISRTQDTTAVLMVLYAAIREYGCPDGLVSDRGGVFRAKRLKTILRTLGITHHHIDPGQPWQNYIETNFNLQRRLADEAEHGFRAATTWDALLAAHAQWLERVNHEDHWAHRFRDDGCHSPVAVLAWVRGRIIDALSLRRIFHSVRFVRQLDQFGYVRFQHFRLYGEYGLAGQPVVLWLDRDTVSITTGAHLLRRYTVTTTPTNTLESVRDPEGFPHPFPHPQGGLWDVVNTDWQMILGPFTARPPTRQRTPGWQLRLDLDAS